MDTYTVIAMAAMFVVGVLFVKDAWAARNAAPQKKEPERTGVVTMKGQPITLIGNEIRIGQKAPDFIVTATDLSEARLGGFKGRIKLIASVPSLDTPVCDLQIHRFNDEASRISKDAVIIFVSMDLPFAQKRFCGAEGITNIKTLSDHRLADFGVNYGVLIKENRLLARAIFIVDKDDVVRYVEYVKELATQPDFAAALAALKEIKPFVR